MAKYTGPVMKKCRALGINPQDLGISRKSSKQVKFRRRKQSDYALQLKEKQKVKFVYGVLEKQFRSYYEKASKMRGVTGENMLVLLERRLDNVVYRLGFAMSRAEARQLVNHGHFTVNGRKVNIPSFQVKPGMVVSLRERSRSLEKIKANVEANAFRQPPKWLDYDAANMIAKVSAVPAREDIDLPIEEHLIVELYSK